MHESRPALFYTDFDLGAVAGDPAPPSVEQELTGGLTKDDYENMFGLNHERLRIGGKELAAGKGDVGRSLFQAAAGIHGLQQICERLQERARTYYLASGKNAVINAEMVRYTAAESAYKHALLRPAAWVELSTANANAHEKVKDLEEKLREAREVLSLANELRAVAPSLRRMDIRSQKD